MVAEMEVDEGAAHLTKKSRLWSGGFADGFGGVAGRNGGQIRSRGKEEGFCRGEREEETVIVSGVGMVGLWLG